MFVLSFFFFLPELVYPDGRHGTERAVVCFITRGGETGGIEI